MRQSRYPFSRNDLGDLDLASLRFLGQRPILIRALWMKISRAKNCSEPPEIILRRLFLVVSNEKKVMRPAS